MLDSARARQRLGHGTASDGPSAGCEGAKPPDERSPGSANIVLVDFEIPGRTSLLAGLARCPALLTLTVAPPSVRVSSLARHVENAATEVTGQVSGRGVTAAPTVLVAACAGYALAGPLTAELADRGVPVDAVIGLNPTAPGRPDLEEALARSFADLGIPGEVEALVESLRTDLPTGLARADVELRQGAASVLGLAADDDIVHDLTQRYLTWIRHVSLCVHAAPPGPGVPRVAVCGKGFDLAVDVDRTLTVDVNGHPGDSHDVHQLIDQLARSGVYA